MMKMPKLQRKDREFIKKIGKETFNFLKTLEKYAQYLNNSNKPHKERDTLFISLSMLPISTIIINMENDIKRKMLASIFLQNRDILMDEMAEHTTKGIKHNIDYIG